MTKSRINGISNTLVAPCFMVDVPKKIGPVRNACLGPWTASREQQGSKEVNESMRAEPADRRNEQRDGFLGQTKRTLNKTLIFDPTSAAANGALDQTPRTTGAAADRYSGER